MSVSLSTGFRQAILGPLAFESIFQNGCIEVRSGLQPASADDAATGELLARITRDGGAWAAGSPGSGLQFVRNGHAIQKPPAHRWVLRGQASGIATWFRLVANAPDAGGQSLSALRIDGAIALSNGPGSAQMLLPSTSVTPATAISLADWWFILP